MSPIRPSACVRSKTKKTNLLNEKLDAEIKTPQPKTAERDGAYEAQTSSPRIRCIGGEVEGYRHAHADELFVDEPQRRSNVAYFPREDGCSPCRKKLHENGCKAHEADFERAKTKRQQVRLHLDARGEYREVEYAQRQGSEDSRALEVYDPGL